jgi:hypothetical protein
MRITTCLILFWLTGFQQTEAMLAILRATYFAKYNNKEDGEIFFADNMNSLNNNEGSTGISDKINNRL